MPNQSRKAVTLDEKIKIFERFFEEGNNEIAGKTIFEGYPIGQWAIQLRNQINRNRELPEEQREKLEKLGILERQFDSTIDEKIDALIEWYNDYHTIDIRPYTIDIDEETISKLKKITGVPYFESDASEEQLRRYNEIIERYKRMQKYKEYIIYRDRAGKLTEEQRNRCREGNLGDRFGVPSQVKEGIQEAVEKYQIPEELATRLLTKYGSVEKFLELSKKYLLEDDNREFDYRDIDCINHVIDLDFNPNSENYIKLIGDLWGEPWFSRLAFISSKKIDAMLENLTDRERRIISESYGLETGEGKSVYDMAEIEGCHSNNIRQLKARIEKKLRRLGAENDYVKRMDIMLLKNDRYISDDEIALLTDMVDELFKSPLIFKHEENLSERDFDIQKLSVIFDVKEILNRRFEEEVERLKHCKVKIEKSTRFGYYGAARLFRTNEIEKVVDLNGKTLEDLINNGILNKEGIMSIISKEAKEDGVYLYEDKEVEEDGTYLYEDKENEVRIEDMGLGTRAYNCLRSKGIKTLGDLEKLTLEELKRMSGQKTIDVIISKAEEYGIHIYENEEEREIVNKLVNEESEASDIVKEDVLIEDMDLSVRTYNCLLRSGIKTLEDLRNLTIDDLSMIRNLGIRSKKEIISKAEEYGIHIYANKEQRERIEKLAARQLTGQDIGKATFDAPTQECDEVQGALTRDILMQKSNNRGEQN